MNHSAKRTPPYLSYRTLRNFLDSLRETALPSRIDRSIMASKSGSSQVLLLSALKYLKLVTDNGLPTPDLQRLVSVEANERQKVWGSIIRKAYAELFESNIDLERTTTQELSEAFVREGVLSPDTVKKCVTFFSLAAKDAGLKLSPHIKPYAGRRRSRFERTVAGTGNYVKPDASTHNGSAISDGLLRKFPNFDPAWTEDERNNWLAAFEKLTKLFNSTAVVSNGDSKTFEVEETRTQA